MLGEGEIFVVMLSTTRKQKGIIYTTDRKWYILLIKQEGK